MSVDNNVETFAHFQIVHIVEDVDGRTAERNRHSFRQGPRPIRRVYVSPNRRNRGNLAQRIEHIRAAHVTGMNNVVRSRQRLQGLIPHEPMRVRDQSQNHANIFFTTLPARSVNR